MKYKSFIHFLGVWQQRREKGDVIIKGVDYVNIGGIDGDGLRWGDKIARSYQVIDAKTGETIDEYKRQ